MPRNHLTEKEIESLTANPYVKSVNTKGIQYKRIFIAENKKGKLPRQIFDFWSRIISKINRMLIQIKRMQRRLKDLMR
jgi:hypothetical protein